MNHKIASIIIVTSLATASYAEYNTTPVDSSQLMQEIYFEQYFYASVGVSPMKLVNDGTNESFETTGISIQAGYQYSKYLAVEFRYSRSVDNVAYNATVAALDDADYPSDFTNISIFAKPMYPIGDVSLYGLIGYGEVGLTNIPKGDVDRAESGLQYGVGVSYKVNKKVSVFVDYALLYDGKGFDNLGTANNNKASMSTVGATYRF